MTQGNSVLALLRHGDGSYFWEMDLTAPTSRTRENVRSQRFASAGEAQRGCPGKLVGAGIARVPESMAFRMASASLCKEWEATQTGDAA